MYKIAFFVPASHLEAVKSAVFTAGAGRIGNYDCCCWQTLGSGQFRALQGSQPWLGQQGELKQVDEYRVELVVADNLIRAVLAALRRSHPYEEPAFDVVKLADL